MEEKRKQHRDRYRSDSAEDRNQKSGQDRGEPGHRSGGKESLSGLGTAC